MIDPDTFAESHLNMANYAGIVNPKDIINSLGTVLWDEEYYYKYTKI